MAALLAAVVVPASPQAPSSSSGVPMKTVYACQGSQLALACPPDHQIRVMRANYGRFSVAICNDKGITDWSVNCMAPRSLRIMQDRCDSLASCIVPSSLEGVTDPCPLTEKYLEAHYLCHSPIHGPYTTGSGEIDKSLEGSKMLLPL